MIAGRMRWLLERGSTCKQKSVTRKEELRYRGRISVGQNEDACESKMDIIAISKTKGDRE